MKRRPWTRWPKKQKRRAPIRTNGHPSGVENLVREHLEKLQKEGWAHNLKQQVRVDLGDQIYWNCDFSYDGVTGLVYAEAKGVKGPRYAMILKLWKSRGPAPLQIWGLGRDGKPKITRVIFPEAKNGS